MKLSIVTKIILLFSAIIAVFMSATYYELRQMGHSTDALYEINEGYIPLSKIVTRIDTALTNLQSDVERVIEIEQKSARGLLSRAVLSYFPKIVENHIVQGVAHCDKQFLIIQTPEQKKFYGEARKSLIEMRRQLESFKAKAEQILAENSADAPISKTDSADLRSLEHRLVRNVKKLSIMMENHIANSFQRVEVQASKASWAGIILSMSAFLVALGLMTLSVFMLKPIRRLTEAAKKIGQGEYRYSLSIPSGDELGTLAGEFEKMRLSLIQRDKALKEQAEELELSNLELSTLKIHYENIIKNLWLPVLVADVQRRLKTVNPQAARIWGPDLYDHIGKPVDDLPLEDGKIGDVIDIGEILERKTTVVREAVKVIDGAGETRRITFTAVPFLDGEKVNGLLIMGEDVTDELRMRKSLLQTERLSAIGPISARIVHEIRNPLSSIVLNTEMLQEELEDHEGFDELKPLMQSIVAEVERMNTITESFLTLSKMPSAETRKVDLNRVISSLAGFYKAEMSKMKVECHSHLFRHPVRADVDEDQIVRVFHNLINNALEAMPEGGILELTSEISEEECVVRVLDSGLGIEEKIIGKIFDPYFSTKEQGTGQGLMIVRQVVEEAGGSVEYEKSDRGGACFIIRLPESSEKGDVKGDEDEDLFVD